MFIFELLLLWSLGWEDPLETSMETYSSILAWRIPWTEEPGGLQSMGVTKSWTQLKQLSTYILTNNSFSEPPRVDPHLLPHWFPWSLPHEFFKFTMIQQQKTKWIPEISGSLGSWPSILCSIISDFSSRFSCLPVAKEFKYHCWWSL